MQEVAALCDRIVVIAHGRVVADASPAALLAETGAATLEDAFVAVDRLRRRTLRMKSILRR